MNFKQKNNSQLVSQFPYVIYDWAGNLMDFGRFKSFDQAEDYLSEKLGDNYEIDRQEYYIELDTKE